LINVIIKKAGLKKLVVPFASTELNKGIVGETEKTIRDIIRRGNTYPYLLCCVAIDEIDAIVPKRDGDQKNSKGVESLTQFLTLIGGVDDVKNVYMIGATNRYNKIDEAFLRRLGDKFYVGNLDSAERTNLLQKIKTECEFDVNFDFLDKNKSLIQVLTTNFSGAAACSLKDRILEFISLNYKPEDKNIQISTDTLIEIIHKVAFSFKVQFAGMTIAQLIQKNKNIEELKEKWKKYENYLKESTGRILIDLNSDVLSMQFELKNGTLFELQLKKEIERIDFLGDIIPFLLFFCIFLEIDFVKMIDTNYVILQGAEGKSSMLSLILDCFIDFDNYENGLLLFDGDTIVGVSGSGKTDDALTNDLNRQINDLEIWKNCIIHIFRKIIKKDESREEKKNKDIHPWCIFTTSEKFLVDSFKDSLKFPLTNKEAEEKQKDQDNREKARKCLNCEKLYYEKDNNLDSCSYHPDYLVNIKSDYSIDSRITENQLKQIIREQKNIEIAKDYVWFCCMKDGLDGCTKNKHSDIESRKKMENYKEKDILDLENGFYTIESIFNDKYVSAVNDLRADSGIIRQTELFKFIKTSNAFDYAVKALSNDKYISVRQSQINQIFADSYNYSPENQIFTIQATDFQKRIFTIKYQNRFIKVGSTVAYLLVDYNLTNDELKINSESKETLFRIRKFDVVRIIFVNFKNTFFRYPYRVAS
jgi:hypothetical protein